MEQHEHHFEAPHVTPLHYKLVGEDFDSQALLPAGTVRLLFVLSVILAQPEAEV